MAMQTKRTVVPHSPQSFHVPILMHVIYMIKGTVLSQRLRSEGIADLNDCFFDTYAWHKSYSLKLLIGVSVTYTDVRPLDHLI